MSKYVNTMPMWLRVTLILCGLLTIPVATVSAQESDPAPSVPTTIVDNDDTTSPTSTTDTDGTTTTSTVITDMPFGTGALSFDGTYIHTTLDNGESATLVIYPANQPYWGSTWKATGPPSVTTVNSGSVTEVSKCEPFQGDLIKKGARIIASPSIGGDRYGPEGDNTLIASVNGERTGNCKPPALKPATCTSASATIDPTTMTVSGSALGENGIKWIVDSNGMMMANGEGTEANFSFPGQYALPMSVSFLGEDGEWVSSASCTFSFTPPVPPVVTPPAPPAPPTPPVVTEYPCPDNPSRIVTDLANYGEPPRSSKG
jgi:hypothetical protein